MLTLEGQVVHVYETPTGTTKEGVEFGGRARVQLLGQQWLRNGESKHDLVDLTVDDPVPFRDAMGQTVRVPVGVFARANTANFFHAKAAPQPLTVV